MNLKFFTDLKCYAGLFLHPTLLFVISSEFEQPATAYVFEIDVIVDLILMENTNMWHTSHKSQIVQCLHNATKNWKINFSTTL